MGCGQSKIGIYQRKSKNKKNGNKRSAENGEIDEETEEAEDTINTENKEPNENDKGEEDPTTDSVTSKIKQMAQHQQQQQQQQQQTGGAVLAQSDISSSQLDFFKMLDEKIENGPDYEESDEEEHKTRMANLMEEWKAACQARQQKKNEAHEQETWTSPARGGKPYQEEYENYPGRRITALDTQRFPTGYSPCPPNATISLHLQNSFRMNSPYGDQPRLQPRIPILANYHPFQPPTEPYNHCEDPTGHPLSTNEPPNPLRTNYSQVLLRQTSINSQLQHYPENQRLYSENIRQFPDFPRAYQDQRPYQIPRTMQTVNVLHEHRMYAQDMNNRPYQVYQEDSRQPEEVQRMMVGQYHDPQRPENIRPAFGSVENQRIYHERLLEKQRQYADNARQMEGPRNPTPFQRAPILNQRSIQEPTRIYRDLDGEEHCFPRQFPDPGQDGSSTRIHNPNPFKMGRSLSVDVQYVAGPPPPREMIPLQGAPGPPQGSPRPLVARGLQTNIHRLPANSVVHFRKPQGAFT